MLKQRDQTKQQEQSGQQLRVSIAKLSSLDPGNKRLDLCGVSGILIWNFLHWRRRRFYAPRRSEARASGHFFAFFKPGCRKHTAIAPCLAGMTTPAERAASLDIGYSTITRWLRESRENGMRGLFHATEFPRAPYTLERVIVTLLYFKCCVPKAGDRELARVVTTAICAQRSSF